MSVKEQFFKWLDTPVDQRVPQTQKEFAALNGVYQERLSYWKSRRKGPRKASKGLHSLEDYLEYLKGRAYDPKSPGKDRELYAKILGWLTTERETKKEELTPDDYINIGNRVVAELRDQYTQGGGRCPVCGGLEAVRDRLLDSEPE